MDIEFKAVKKKPEFVYVLPITEKEIKEFNKNGYIKAKGFSNCRVRINEKGKYYPKIGDMIAVDKDNPTDQWLIEATFFKDNHDFEFTNPNTSSVIIR